MYKHTFDKTILRSYDIRGIYGKTLTDKDAFMLGFFFGTTVRKKNPDKKHPLIIIGMDGRLSSPMLEQKLNEGLENSGCEIFRIGLGPTPMLYFASNYYKADGAIQVTGSHNPKDYNGFKIVLNQNSFFGEDIQKLGHFASKGYSNTYHGFSKSVEINSKYIDEITKPLTNDQKETILARSSASNAAQLVVGAQFTVIDQAANPNSEGIHTKDLYYVDGNNTVTFDPTAIVLSPNTDFKSGYLDITISNNDAETSDDLNIISGNGLSGSIVKTGNAIRYVDPTHGSMHIGNIDPTLHGQNSNGLRINFFDQIIIPNSSTILNGDFSNGLTNWTKYEDRVDFGNNFTLSDGSSIPTPNEADMATVTYTGTAAPPNPSVVGNDDVALADPISFSVDIENGQLSLKQGRYFIQLGFGIVHGPAAVSDTFTAEVGDILRLDYTAAGDYDDYHVAGYVFNTTTNAITLAINETGTTGSGRKSIEITQAGDYRFVFVNGSFDKTGYRGVGADMTIDNIESEKQYSIPDTAVQQLLRSTTYSSSSDNQHYVKDVTISANDGTNTLSDTSKIFNTEYEGKIMVAPTLNLEKPVSYGATNSLGPGGAADPSVVVSKIEEVQTRIGSAKAEAKAHYAVLESAIDSSTDMRAQFFWGADAISDPEFFADTAYFTKQQIMQDNAAAILAQANKSQGGLMTLVDSPNTIEA